MTGRRLTCLFLSALALAALPLGANATLLVKNHEPQATIVVGADASPQLQALATTLQGYIQKSTGARLPVSGKAGGGTVISLGNTALAREAGINTAGLDEDGFIIRTWKANTIIIAGGSDWGTEFGVYDFLERFFDIRWLMPTELGTDIPVRETVDLPAIDIRQEPVFLSRQLSPINPLNPGAENEWGRVNRLRGRIAFHHNLKNLFPVSKYGRTHPEFYPVIDGRRYIPANDDDARWQPNLSAPGAVDAAAGTINDYFDRTPDAETFSLGIDDSNNWDQSSASLAHRSGRKNYLGFEDVSDEYFTWANAVAGKVLAKHPGKLFGTLAYNGNAEPPRKTPIDPHIVPFLTYDRMKWLDPDVGAQGRQLTQEWEKASPMLGFYDYMYGFSYLLPRVYFHASQEFMSWGADHHVRFFYGELYPNWGEGPKAWLLTRLLWNPNQKTDDLLDDWYVHFAGKQAAPALKSFYAIWENFWTSTIFTSKWYSKKGEYLPFNGSPIYLASVTSDQVLRADNLMNQALQRADTPQRKARVAELQKMWQLYKLSIVAYQKVYAAHDPSFRATAEKTAAAAHLPNGIPAAQQRKELLEALKSNPLFAPSVKSIQQFSGTAGDTWLFY